MSPPFLLLAVFRYDLNIKYVNINAPITTPEGLDTDELKQMDR